MMDRKPESAPFAKGTRVRYVGTRHASFVADDGSSVPYIAPGIEVQIVKTTAGRQGTLLPLPEEPWEDSREPILDTTRDGYSVYEVEVPGNEKPFGRIIWPADAHEWERV